MESEVKEKKKNIFSNIDLTKGNSLVAILLFAIPLLFGNLFQQLYNFVDSYIVGNYVGDEALAAVSSSAATINLIINLFQGIAVGAGIVIAQHFGAKDITRMRKSIHTTVAFGLILSVVSILVGVIGSPYLLKLMQIEDDVLPLSTTYLQIYFAGSGFIIMYNIGASILRAIGDSKRPLYYLIISSLVNIGLDYLFVCSFKWGVVGAGVATIISQFVSMVLTFITLMVHKTDYQVKFKELAIDKEEIKLVLRYGLPTGLQNSIISISNVFIQSYINSFGKLAQAGCGSYNKIDGFAIMPSGSFAMALSTFVGQNVGAKQYKKARNGSIIALLVDIGIAEFLGVFVYIFAPQLIGLFTTNEEIIAYGTQQARLISPFYFLLAFSHGMAAILRGFGYSKSPMWVMIICWCLVRVGVLTLIFNIDSLSSLRVIETIFWLYPITWSISFITYIIIFIIAMKRLPADGEEFLTKNKKVIIEDQN